MPWRWPRWEHLSKMKIFWKHSAIFLSHTFATKFIMNSDEIPSPAFHTKGQLHVHFLRISCRDYHGAEGCAKKRDLFRCFELIKLSSITETLVTDTCSRNEMLPWRLVCQGERHWRGVLGHPPLASLHCMCLGYAHSLSLKCKGYEALEMWGL